MSASQAPGLVTVNMQAVDDFKQGFTTVLTTVLSNASSVLEQKKIKQLVIGILITVFVVYIITIPIRILLFILQLILSIFSSHLASVLSETRSNITFFALFLDSFWYIPLFMLVISRALGLLDLKPFHKRLMQLNASFALRLEDAEIKQNVWTNLGVLIKRFGELFILSIVVVILRLIPIVRVFVSLFILGYQLYRKIKNVNYHIGNVALTLIGVAVTALFSNTVANALLYCAEFYLASLAISREFLAPYFSKVTYKMEKKDKVNNQWILFGFGTALTVFFGIPVFGLIFYPVFQMCAADILIAMLNSKKLSFEHSRKCD
eukprot:74694_1